MSDSYTRLNGMLLVTEDEFAETEPDAGTLYIVQEQNSITLFLGSLPLKSASGSNTPGTVALVTDCVPASAVILGEMTHPEEE